MTPTAGLLWTSIAGIVLLATVHIFAGRLQFLRAIPRSRWLSFGSGTSVAYVFIHLLPQLAAAQNSIEGHLAKFSLWPNHHLYLMALGGLVAFYGLERLAKTSRRLSMTFQDQDQTSTAVFWLHISSFGLYNLIIGYLAFHLEEDDSVQNVLLFFLAIGFHFLVNDYGLSDHHKRLYQHTGRWVLSAAVLLGGVLGLSLAISEPLVLTGMALVSGGVILNVLKEELPSERESRFSAFLLGVIIYTTILLSV